MSEGGREFVWVIKCLRLKVSVGEGLGEGERITLNGQQMIKLKIWRN